MTGSKWPNEDGHILILDDIRLGASGARARKILGMREEILELHVQRLSAESPTYALTLTWRTGLMR